MDADVAALAQRYMAGLRSSAPIADEATARLYDALHFDAGRGIGDEAVWEIAMYAVRAATDDGERWNIGDGLIDVTVSSRPALLERWVAAYDTDPAVRAVFEVMWDEVHSRGHRPVWCGRARVD
ncbi:MAG TPA: hypothetical protein VEA78_02280 [Acidimicrobiales bacterium]|nr:hypothetical protein [Acidimicrobiales bacterium]